ncbi:MAG TPA: hypothetical protein VH639_28080 [Bryobacteraceae bacterium]
MKFILPAFIADYGGDFLGGGRVFLRPERSSELGLDAQHVEEISADQLAKDVSRLRVALGLDRERAVFFREKSRESPSLIAIKGVFGVGEHAKAVLRRVGEGHDHFARARNVERPEKHRIHEAEDGAVGADAEGER